jgi:hypothetical protein
MTLSSTTIRHLKAMHRRRFLTLVFPRGGESSGLHSHTRFFIWSHWLCNPSGESTPRFVFERVFVSPHLSFSIVPREFARRHSMRLTPIRHEAEITRPVPDAERRIATLRFADHLTSPSRSDQCRTFSLIALVPGSSSSKNWRDLELGSDFLLEHRMQFVVDYARIVYRFNPVTPGSLHIDPNVPCGSLAYPGD